MSRRRLADLLVGESTVLGTLPLANPLGLLGRELSRPLDPIVLDPVVRFAGETPDADRGAERDALAVEDQLPLDRRQRRRDLDAAATEAAVKGNAVADRDVEDALL